MTVLAQFQPWYREVRGEQLNALVNQINTNTTAAAIGAGRPLATAITTVGAGTLTSAALVGGAITRSGPTGAFADTTATAAQLNTTLGSGAAIGTSWFVEYKNTTAFSATIGGGTGVTMSGRLVIPANSVGMYLLTKNGATTYTAFGVGVYEQAFVDTFAAVATADDGTTQTLTAAMIVGGKQVYHKTLGGATPSLTLPLASAIDTALPDMRVGQSFTLRIINSNSGTATIVTNTGWTLTGTLTLATNTWRDFVVTKTGTTATYTAVQVGTGTTS